MADSCGYLPSRVLIGNVSSTNLLLFQVNRDPQMVMDIINEEETQFLKTLNRGRNILERTIGKLNGQTILPGIFFIYSTACWNKALDMAK